MSDIADDHDAGSPPGTTRPMTHDRRWLATFTRLVLLAGTVFLTTGCDPDASPLKSENELLRKQKREQESAIVLLQKENTGMQRQIERLTKDLKGAKIETERSEAERRALAAMLD